MDMQEFAIEQIAMLSGNPTSEEVSRSAALALWEIVKVLSQISTQMPHKSEL